MIEQDAKLAEQILHKIGAAKFDLARLSAGRAGDPSLRELREALDRASLAAARLAQPVNAK